MGFDDILESWDFELVKIVIEEKFLNVIFLDIEFFNIDGIEIFEYLNDYYLYIYVVMCFGYNSFENV